MQPVLLLHTTEFESCLPCLSAEALVSTYQKQPPHHSTSTVVKKNKLPNKSHLLNPALSKILFSLDPSLFHSILAPRHECFTVNAHFSETPSFSTHHNDIQLPSSETPTLLCPSPTNNIGQQHVLSQNTRTTSWLVDKRDVYNSEFRTPQK
jgi:hypothetical protein